MPVAGCRGPRRAHVDGTRAFRISVLAAALGIAGVALAQSTGGNYALDSSSIDNGGGRATGGVYVLDGTIAQHDATNASSGGVYALNGGFRRSGAEGTDVLFANGFE